jgi:hypothetical protein
VAVSGNFNGQSVFGLNLSTDTIPTDGPFLGGTTTRYILDILIFNGTTIRRTWASTVQNTLESALSIDGGRRGAILRLNLPEGNSGLQQGDVYRDSAGYIRVQL